MAIISLNDVLSALKLWPKWKRIEAAVDQVDALGKRVDDLEKRLARCPGEACPKCGELAFRAARSEPHPSFDFGNAGVIIRHMQCEMCGFQEEHTVSTSKERS